SCVIACCFLLLTLGAALGHLLLVFLFVAFSLRKLLLHAAIFLCGAFRGKWDTVLANQLLHWLAIRQRINFVNFHRLFLQLTLAVDLTVSLSLLECVFCNAVLEFVLVFTDFAQQCCDVDVLSRWIENAIVDAGVVLDTLQQQRQFTGSVEVHADTMRFENAVLWTVIVELHSRVSYIAVDLREQRRLHAEVILKSRAAARREFDDVRRL